MADKKDLKKDNNSQAPKNNNSKDNTNKPKNKKSSKKKIFKWIGLSILFAILAVAVIGVGYVVAVVKNTPPIDINKVVNVDQTLQAYDSKGKLMASLHGKEDYQKIDSKDIPQNLKDAIVSIEDERFYEHNGIDVKRILSVVVKDSVYIVTGKGSIQGASTLTQQLVKNTLLTNERSIERKVREMYLALQLEKMLSKDEILTAYLNHFPVGGIAYGAQAGAKMYFDKNAKDLNLIQCAYLAGVTQATTTYNAYTQKDPNVYLNRTKLVLSKMLEHNYITQAEYDKAIKDLDDGKLKFKKSKVDYRLPYEDFVYASVDQVKRDLKEKYKYSDEQVDNLIQSGGLKVYTTMDRSLQDYTQKVLNNYSNFNIPGYDTLDKNGIPLLQASATITDYKTGEVLALVGGRGDQGARSLNRAYDSLRSIGSSTKPFTVYGPALDTKKITAATTIDDAPIPNGSISYKPNNAGKHYEGLITSREALRVSSNVGAALTQNKVGDSTSRSYGEKLGIKYTESNGPATYALGEFRNSASNPDGANTFIMSSAAGAVGNNGVYVEPRLYTKVVDSNGKVILESKKEDKQVFSPQASYILYDMMKGPLTYNAPYAKLGAMPSAGKTGTTEYNKDYWFVGLTPHLSGAVWVGYDNQKSIKGGGSGATASNLWGIIMRKANEGLSTQDIQKPSGIVEVPVCKDSGLLPTDLCKNDPRGSQVYTELFIDGTQPTSYCETHVSAQVNTLNGKLATDNTPPSLIATRIFIKTDNPNPVTDDYKYLLPTSYDTMTSIPQVEQDKDNNKDKNKDKDKGKDKDKDKKPGNETPGNSDQNNNTPSDVPTNGDNNNSTNNSDNTNNSENTNNGNNTRNSKPSSDSTVSNR